MNKWIMQLTINKIAQKDEGEYYCHAENAFGSATQPVSVRIRNVVSKRPYWDKTLGKKVLKLRKSQRVGMELIEKYSWVILISCASYKKNTVNPNIN